MEVREFQDSRKAELDDFQKQYTSLKQQYSSTLSSAINESDPEKQQELIGEIQQLNSQIAEEVRGILGVLNKGTDTFDPKTLDSLTADLIKYQKDYAEIEKTKDRVNTLKLIHAGSLKDLESATYWYYIYIAVLILLCIIIAFQVWKIPSSGMFSWFRTPTGQG
jgi:hypothetical protein